MWRLLVPRERKGNQGFETLIVIQRVECYKTLTENLEQISSRREADEVEDLGCNLLRENCYRVVELGFADCKIADRKLYVRLRKPNLGCVWLENRQLHGNIRHNRRRWRCWWWKKIGYILKARRLHHLVLFLTHDVRLKTLISLALTTFKKSSEFKVRK